MKKSNVYKFRGKFFRYDFTCGIVEFLVKATDEQYEDNREWQSKYGKNLWDIDSDGFIELSTAGLSKENWKHKEVRDEYLAGWIDEMEEEMGALAEDFLRTEVL